MTVTIKEVIYFKNTVGKKAYFEFELLTDKANERNWTNKLYKNKCFERSSTRNANLFKCGFFH